MDQSSLGVVTSGPQFSIFPFRAERYLFRPGFAAGGNPNVVVASIGVAPVVRSGLTQDIHNEPAERSGIALKTSDKKGKFSLCYRPIFPLLGRR
jgi:hypothetical protein